MALIPIPLEDAAAAVASPQQARQWCQRLEEGNVLFFPQTPISLPEQDRAFLLGLGHSHRSLHKNLAYKPHLDRIAGADLQAADPHAAQHLLHCMRAYSQQVQKFLTDFLSPYQARWQVDYASYRPLQEKNRTLPLHKRNDLMHTDAFPTRPTQGARILRFFNNIHPEESRHWIVGEPFRALLPQFVPESFPLPRAESGWQSGTRAALCQLGLGALLPALRRSPYDQFMMRFHNFLKENSAYQRSGWREELCLPPGSSWMVYTDMVPHAVLSGQCALEQTILVAPEALQAPEHAPLTVLEAYAGQPLTRRSARQGHPSASV